MTAGFDPTFDEWDPTLGEIYGTDASGSFKVVKTVTIAYNTSGDSLQVNRISNIKWNNLGKTQRQANIAWNDQSTIAFQNQFRINWSDHRTLVTKSYNLFWQDYSNSVRKSVAVKWAALAPKTKAVTFRANDRKIVSKSFSILFNDIPSPPTFTVNATASFNWNDFNHTSKVVNLIWADLISVNAKDEVRYGINETVQNEIDVNWNDTVTVVGPTPTLVWHDTVLAATHFQALWSDRLLATKTAKIKFKDEAKVTTARTVQYNNNVSVVKSTTILWNENSEVSKPIATIIWSQTNPIISYTDNKVIIAKEVNNVNVIPLQEV